MSNSKNQKIVEAGKPFPTVYFGIGLVVLVGLFFLLPLLANAGGNENNNPVRLGANTSDNGSKNLGLASAIQIINFQVQIPCGGHTGLIVSELKKLPGITEVNLITWNSFQVKFDSTKTSKEQILGAEIFKTYPAKLS